jgi:hypothetical protein
MSQEFERNPFEIDHVMARKQKGPTVASNLKIPPEPRWGPPAFGMARPSINSNVPCYALSKILRDHLAA